MLEGSGLRYFSVLIESVGNAVIDAAGFLQRQTFLSEKQERGPSVDTSRAAEGAQAQT